mgnify:CR=1 FL=1
MSDFWSWFIIIIVAINLLGCAGLLLWNNQISPEEAAKETTGHSFDGIQERNAPLPRWWLFLFIGTLIFACVYLALYPGLGKFVWDEFQNGSSESLARIMVAVITIGLIGFLLDRLMLSVQRMVSWDKNAVLR